MRTRKVVAGDVVIALVPYSGGSARRRGHTSKVRPCLVMDVIGTQVWIRGIYGAGGCDCHKAGGRRVLHWRHAGLRKPSIVSPGDVLVSTKELLGKAGRLSMDDHRRLITTATAPDGWALGARDERRDLRSAAT